MAGEAFLAAADAQVSLKKKTAAARSWILFDSAGKDTILDVDKYAIMHRVQIHARDLRILDPLLSYPSAILGREGAIVLNLEHIKAIITADEVFLRDPSEDNVVPIVEELRRRLQSQNINQAHGEGKESTVCQHDLEAIEEDGMLNQPSVSLSMHKIADFTIKLLYLSSLSLEVALEAICSYLDARATELETAAYPALDELTSKMYVKLNEHTASHMLAEKIRPICISSRNLDRVRKLKSSMTRLTARVQKVRDELEQLLDDDDDMADLYLSRKIAGASTPVSGSGVPNWAPPSPTIGSKISRASKASAATIHGNENDVEELEMLLEAYFMQIDGTLNKMTTLREYIDDTEDYINIQLDNHRNQLIQLELFLSSGTVSLSIYSLVAGVFGMNIPYSWNNDHGYVYKWVVIISGLASAFVFIFIIAYARHKGLVGS
ncbi:hypothetical protein ZIOFF_029587 [Zingiber officinale]|uniref:Magnesium transporter n=1 Tax=Zingiber officinale TaxID=94328 RepID=A0A8J5H1S5_ZINOF|nr:hypothetical protein ZIOFF_029587 [Zingiber officinale]